MWGSGNTWACVQRGGWGGSSQPTNTLGDDAESKTDLGHLSPCKKKKEWVQLKTAAKYLWEADAPALTITSTLTPLKSEQCASSPRYTWIWSKSKSPSFHTDAQCFSVCLCVNSSSLVLLVYTPPAVELESTHRLKRSGDFSINWPLI